MRRNYAYSLAVCVKPLSYFADWWQLVHFMEVWRQLGAQRFIIYVMTVTPRVRQTLQVSSARWWQFPPRVRWRSDTKRFKAIQSDSQSFKVMLRRADVRRNGGARRLVGAAAFDR